jgi:hypothetical protein
MPDRYDDELNRFWNEINERRTFAAQDLDPGDAAIIRRLQSLAAAPLPGAPRERVWRGLEATYDSNSAGRLPVTDAGFSVTPDASPRRNGRVHARPYPVPTRLEPGWLGRPILRYAAVAILILGFVLAIDIIRPGHEPNGHLGGAPAIQAPATPSPPASPTTTLFTITLPAEVVPHNTERITGISHDKYLAGSTSVWRPYCCDGPVVQYQLTGAIQVTGTDQLQIVRADGTVDRIPANTEATVNTGDTLVTLNQTGITTVNSGTIDAEILNWNMLDSPGDRFGGRSGQAGLAGMTHVVASDFLGNMVDLPGAVTVTLQRLELGPEQAVYSPEHGLQFPVTLDITTEPIFDAGAGSYFKAGNLNGKPTTTVYVLTLLPADASGPPGVSTPVS